MGVHCWRAEQALMQDCAKYFNVTGRRVTFEYTLMMGTNDDPQQVGGGLLSLSCLAGG